MNEKERVELIMKCYNLTPSQFADRTGIQRASVSHILSGRNKPSLEVMLKIYESFPGLDMAWLMTGKGMVPEQQMQHNVVEEPLSLPMPELFVQSQMEPVPTPATHSEPAPQKVSKIVQPRPQVAERSSRRASSRSLSQPETTASVRKIKEIRIFYTDGTYETMIPER